MTKSRPTTPTILPDTPATPDRRSYDTSAEFAAVRNISAQTRVAVLEKIAENHDRRLTEIEDFNRSVVDRLDQKIQLDASNHVSLERQLVKAVTSLEVLSTAVSKASHDAVSASDIAHRLETIGLTILKTGSVLAIVLGGLWAVFTFLMRFAAG